QVLDIDAGERAPPAPQKAASPATLSLPGGDWTLGWAGPGFASDNERGAQPQRLPGFTIDARPASWAAYLPAVEAGAVPLPRFLRRDGARWWRRAHGDWHPLALQGAACHLSASEAHAWCAWAG